MAKKSIESNTTINELVFIGASAGAIEALSILFNSLPATFPAPIVVAQHLDTSRPRSLALIFRRQTPLTVVEIDGNRKLENGTIYIVPPDKHVVILDGQVELRTFSDGPHPSVDVLMSSAAAAYGDRLYAVILTGQGTDGAAGAAVKQVGGTVIVQNPSTAPYPSMPLALPPNMIDFTVDLENIGPLLYKLLTGISVNNMEQPAEDILQKILAPVTHQAAIDFCPYKRTSLLRRISRRMITLQINTLGEYADYINEHRAEVAALVNTLLINVTEFFRDPEAFAYLKAEVLPDIIEQGRGRNKMLRFWSAACATGEEPYSLAMLLTDLLGDEINEWSVKIFATDLDEAAINFARRGFYPEPLLKNVPHDYRERFFDAIDGGYRVRREIRQLVTFGQKDLSRSGPFPRINLLLCRNVLIYFNTELQAIVLNNFAFALQPSGYLFLGKAEIARPSQMSFELVNKTWKIYRCIGSASPLPRRFSLSSLEPIDKQAVSPLIQGLVGIGIENAKLPQGELGQLRRMNELLLRFLPMGLVAIDRSYRLLTANLAVRRLLGLHDTGEGMDFLHSVRGIPYESVRAAIDKAFRERTLVNVPEIELNSRNGGNGRFISLSISLMQVERAASDFAAISIIDITDQVRMRQQLESARSEQVRLMDELSTLNKQLGDRNKELVDSNEELHVSNEELILAQEELQSTVEEYETTNEELQAANEELETTNEETQAINEELQATNDEFRARTQELMEVGQESERQHKQLQHLSRQQLKIQELERNNVARELHDQIGQDLTAINMMVERTMSNESPEQLVEVQKIVAELINKVRSLALDLRPSLLDDFGLEPTLDWYFKRYTSQTGIKVEANIEAISQRFNMEIETTAYRIIQEALTNVARHAKVKKVAVHIWVEGRTLCISVEDNGVGFNPTAHDNSFGLGGMRERARILSANLIINSKLGQGTHISVGIPITEEPKSEDTQS